jgi:hypothetical protein
MITVVKEKVVVAEAVGKWKSLLRFPRAPFARLFHSFSPANGFSFFSCLSRFFAHRFAAHFDPMRLVHQSVEDPVGQRGIADLLVPAGHRQLGSKDGGTGLVAIFADLPDLTARPSTPDEAIIPYSGEIDPKSREVLVLYRKRASTEE